MSDTQFTKATLFEHVAKHPERNFISIHENVYDVTEFLDEVKRLQWVQWSV